MHSAIAKSQRSRGVIDRYREFLPVSASTPIVSLGEGNTPLIYCQQLSKRVGRGCRVFVKNEGVNPTGSFKDRGMTVAVSKSLERGARAIICASTGNTSASASAYAARAGISCIVILPAGKIATGKLLQAFVYGARIVAIDGNFDDALRIVRELGETGDAPDLHLLPVGNAGNITAYWAGYREYREHKRSTKLPTMLGFQAAGAAPIFHNRIIEKPETIASAIRIGNPASWKQAHAANAESRGAIDVVSDEEIVAAQNWLAQHEGIFVEPASAASIAGLFKCCESHEAAYSFQKIPEASRIVCTVTGHGLKDPDAIIQRMEELKPAAATTNDVRRAIRL